MFEDNVEQISIEGANQSADKMDNRKKIIPSQTKTVQWKKIFLKKQNKEKTVLSDQLRRSTKIYGYFPKGLKPAE